MPNEPRSAISFARASITFVWISVVATGVTVLAVPQSRAEVPTGSERRTPIVRAVDAAGPAIVNVFTETVVETPFRRRAFPDPFFDGMFPDAFRRPQAQRRSLGSGVIVDRNGTIVTNEHVIVQASQIRVLMADKREFTARLIGADSDLDLAVLKIDTDEPLPFVPLPREESILIGETVIAIGNPYGLSHTVTVGVVSAVGRVIQSGDVVYRDFIQTDASINPGNSGGPLLDIEGHLMGINTAIFREAQGIGFAIPAHRVRNVVEQILHFGSVQPPWIGLLVQDLTPDIAFHFGVEPGSGVVVATVEDDSPAHAAGLLPGQVIQRVDGERVGDATEYTRRTLGVTAGDTIEVTVLDGKEKRPVRVRVGSFPAERIDAVAWRALGIAVEENPHGPGVAVARLRAGSPAQEIGMQPGDAVAALGGRDVADVDDFRRGIAAVRNSNQVLVSVVRGRRLYRVTMPLDRRAAS